MTDHLEVCPGCTSTTEMAQFVAARYDEDEAAERARLDRSRTLRRALKEAAAAMGADAPAPSPPVSRVLADLAAKRRILARHARCANGEGCCSGRTVGREWCDDMADLAAAYAEHPRFKPEWKIDD